MAEFNEKTARQIVEKFSLNEKTIKVWKTRNKIPDRYFDQDFKKRVSASGKAEKVLSCRIIDVLFMQQINTDTFIALTEAPLRDIKSGKSSFSEETLLKAKKEINRLKIDVVSLIKTNNSSTIKKIVKDVRIKYYPVLRSELNDQDIKRILFQLDKHTSLDPLLYEKLKQSFVKFALQLNI